MPYGETEAAVAILLVALLLGAARLLDTRGSLERGIAAFVATLRSPGPDVHFTRVLARATEEATRLRHQAVGPDHILLALTLEPDPTTLALYARFQVDPEHLRWRLKESLVLGEADAAHTGSPFSPIAQHVLGRAHAEARALEHSSTGPSHLLLGLLSSSSTATDLLTSMGFTLEQARAEARRSLHRGALGGHSDCN